MKLDWGEEEQKGKARPGLKGGMQTNEVTPTQTVVFITVNVSTFKGSVKMLSSSLTFYSSD